MKRFLFATLLLLLSVTAANPAAQALNGSTNPVFSQKKGSLLIYSQKGRYDSVKISLSGSNSPAKTCAGSFANSSSANIKKLSSKSYVKVACSAVSTTAGSHYIVQYGKSGKYTAGPTINADVDPSKYTHVHPSGAGSPSTASTTQADTPDVVTPTIRVLAALSSNKKTATGYVEVAVPGEELTKVECAGSVTISYASSTPNTDPQVNTTAVLKYVKATSNTSFNDSYCAAKIKNVHKFDPGLWITSAHINASNYFNAADGVSDSGHAVTIPKR